MPDHVAKLFPNGRSQAVRLPAAFRFEGDEVYIRRDDETGDIILSPVPNTWDGFFAVRDAAGDEVEDFLKDRLDPAPQARALFDEPPTEKKPKRRRPR